MFAPAKRSESDSRGRSRNGSEANQRSLSGACAGNAQPSPARPARRDPRRHSRHQPPRGGGGGHRDVRKRRAIHVQIAAPKPCSAMTNNPRSSSPSLFPPLLHTHTPPVVFLLRPSPSRLRSPPPHPPHLPSPSPRAYTSPPTICSPSYLHPHHPPTPPRLLPTGASLPSLLPLPLNASHLLSHLHPLSPSYYAPLPHLYSISSFILPLPLPSVPQAGIRPDTISPTCCHRRAGRACSRLRISRAQGQPACSTIGSGRCWAASTRAQRMVAASSHCR